MTLSNDDKICLERLFSYLGSNADGLVSTLAPLCLADAPPGLHELLTKNCNITRSVIVVIEGILAEGCRPWDSRIRGLLNTMLQACDDMQTSLFTLDLFRTVSSDELREATNRLQRTYHGL